VMLQRSSLFGKSWKRIIGAPAAFGVIRHGEVIAKVDVQQRTQRCYELNEMVVHPNHRRQGLASGIATDAAKWILARQGIPLYTAFSQNSPAVLLAESLGFECFTTQLCCKAVPISGKA
jgi:predicted GNAT family acetyltransferase